MLQCLVVPRIGVTQNYFKSLSLCLSKLSSSYFSSSSSDLPLHNVESAASPETAHSKDSNVESAASPETAHSKDSNVESAASPETAHSKDSNVESAASPETAHSKDSNVESAASPETAHSKDSNVESAASPETAHSNVESAAGQSHQLSHPSHLYKCRETVPS
ncbi:UNVERIFIED_CONTAM: hypothetical protein FKN15_007969 [Acipenser sinensis]